MNSGSFGVGIEYFCSADWCSVSGCDDFSDSLSDKPIQVPVYVILGDD
jgi:hypothetical protein